MPPFWSHQPVPWGGFPFCLFQPHSLCTLSCLWEICRGSGTDSNAVQQEMNTCNWPSLSYRNSRTSKSRTSSRHCLMDLSPQSLQGRLPGRGGYQGPSAEPCTAARKQAPSAATHCKHSGPLLLGGGKITAVPSGCCSSGLQPPHKHQASVLLGAESDCVHEVHPLGWLKQTNLRIYSNSMFGFRKTTLRLEDSLEGLGTQKSC